MVATKRQESKKSLGARWLSGFAGGQAFSSTAAIGGVFFVVVVASVVYGWRHWGRAAVARPIYRVSAESIQITPPPGWIRTDVRAEVVRDGAIHDLSIFDKDATIRVYQAFELHPWVAKVLRVSKHPPARLAVDLEYRQPIAWVEVPGAKPGDEGGVIPVDSSAFVLPSRDFSKEDLQSYLRISIKEVRPYGLAGTAWGDPRVVGAAKIAAALQNSWQSLGLYRIQLASDHEMAYSQTEPVYELETVGQQHIVWGNAPGTEGPDEPPATVKRDRLVQLIESAGSLDKLPATGIDLRDPNKLRPAHTASRR